MCEHQRLSILRLGAPLSAPQQPRRPLLWRLLLGLFVAAATLGVAELGARLVLPHTPATFVATTPDGARGFLQREGERVTPRFQDRFAIPPFSAAPEAGPRVVWLGGSTARGGSDGLRMGDEAPALTAEALGIEVLNLGAPGMDSRRLRALLPEVLALQPALIVLQTGHNDYGNATFQSLGGADGLLLARLRAALERSRLFLAVELSLRGGVVVTHDPLAQRSAIREISVGERLRVLEELEANLDAMLAQTRAEGVPMVLVTPISNPAAPSVGGGCPELTAELRLTPQGRGLFGVPSNVRVPQVEALMAQDPDCDHLELVLGRVLYDRAKYAQAIEILDRLREQDPTPLRAPQAVDAALAARAGEGVFLADVDGAARRAGQGLEPPQLFSDNLHLSALGHRFVAGEVAPVVGEVLGLPAPSIEPVEVGPLRPLR